jgi:ribosomal protein S14
MDFSGNPFGAPQPQATATNAANPFGGSSEALNPWGVPQPNPPDSESMSNPFGSVPPSMQHGSSHSTYSASTFGAPSNLLPAIAFAEYSAAPPPSIAMGNPFGAPPPSQQEHHSVVLAHNQTNPYAMSYSTGPQSIVPALQSSQPWALPNYHQQHHQQQQQLVPAASYDPFAKPPPLPQQQPPPPPEPHEIDYFFAPAPPQPPPPPQPQPPMEPVPDKEPPTTTTVATTNGYSQKEPPYHSEKDNSAKSPVQQPPDIVAPPPGTLYPPQIQYGQRPDVPPDRDTSQDVRNPYSPLLAREAPPGASPLPKADLVRKRGFALARISFRTIVMKKWKQTYWVQYGPHTMLWFRSQADFDDWLNNPYHMQTERNFLIKLAVNFVHDLYKPNVRGYQVTQCRTKGYGNKIVRQFKLERWMDYGPTIAAAFGSYDPNEVDALREAIVECMRNTPLEGGIRATGAVRQPHPSVRPARREDDDDDDNEGTCGDGVVGGSVPPPCI